MDEGGSLITSQIDTAPKRGYGRRCGDACLITSQIDTAPKLPGGQPRGDLRLITSQIDTAPKRATTPVLSTPV